MKLRIRKARRIQGIIHPSGDKSISHRALILSSLIDGVTHIKGISTCSDCHSTARALQALGVRVKWTGEEVIVYGGSLKEPQGVLDMRNSGTGMRLILGVLAAQDFFVVLTGDRSLRRRPMDRVISPLRKMGAEILARGGDKYAPIAIKGTPRLRPIRHISRVPSAQVKSSILLAGLFANGETSVEEPLQSRDHTERMLSYFGIDVEREGLRTTLRGPALPIRRNSSISVPRDISSASFFIVAALLLPDSEVVIPGVGVNPTRMGLVEVLTKMGGSIKVEKIREECGEPVADIHVKKSNLKGIDVGGELIPRMIDEIPIFTIAACAAEGETRIYDASELRVKETDRLKALSRELSKMGAKITEYPDGLKIEGGYPLKGCEVSSYGDHRMAMALAVAGLIAEEETIVDRAECINTSFPEFVDILFGAIKE